MKIEISIYAYTIKIRKVGVTHVILLNTWEESI